MEYGGGEIRWCGRWLYVSVVCDCLGGGVVTGDVTGKEVEVCGFECDGCVTGNLMSVCD